MMMIWLVVTGTMEFYDFPYIGNFIIPTDSYFSEGWLNHLPDYHYFPFIKVGIHHFWKNHVDFSQLKKIIKNNFSRRPIPCRFESTRL